MKQINECIETPAFDTTESSLVGLGIWQGFLFMVKGIEDDSRLSSDEKLRIFEAIDKLVDAKVCPPTMDQGQVSTSTEVAPASNFDSIAASIAGSMMGESKVSDKFSLKRMRQLSGITKTEDLL